MLSSVWRVSVLFQALLLAASTVQGAVSKACHLVVGFIDAVRSLVGGVGWGGGELKHRLRVRRVQVELVAHRPEAERPLSEAVLEHGRRRHKRKVRQRHGHRCPAGKRRELGKHAGVALFDELRVEPVVKHGPPNMRCLLV